MKDPVQSDFVLYQDLLFSKEKCNLIYICYKINVSFSVMFLGLSKSYNFSGLLLPVSQLQLIRWVTNPELNNHFLLHCLKQPILIH